MKPRLSTILWWNLSSQCAVGGRRAQGQKEMPLPLGHSPPQPVFLPLPQPTCPHPTPKLPAQSPRFLAPSQGEAVSTRQGIPQDSQLRHGHVHPLPWCLWAVWATRELDFSPHLVTEGPVPWAGRPPNYP